MNRALILSSASVKFSFRNTLLLEIELTIKILLCFLTSFQITVDFIVGLLFAK